MFCTLPKLHVLSLPQVSGETDWHLESSQLLHCNGGVAIFNDASIPKKASDLAAIAEVLEHSRLSIGKGTKNHQLVDASVSIVYLLEGSMRSLPTKNADATLKQFDLCLDMQEAHEDVLDTTISSYYLQVCACFKIRSRWGEVGPCALQLTLSPCNCKGLPLQLHVVSKRP